MRRAVTLAGIVLAAATGAMQLGSSDISAAGAIAQKFMATDCGGQNRSPALAWSAPPKNVKSFALIMHDADAPIPGGFYHWVVYNLPAASRGLAPNASLRPDELGDTSLAKQGYYGPCPPAGPAHHYRLTLYALDLARLEAASPLTGAQLEARIEGHVLARAVLASTASRP
jgi:Raf kinase inhibitor-like YbhB/YbcL family protein